MDSLWQRRGGNLYFKTQNTLKEEKFRSLKQRGTYENALECTRTGHPGKLRHVFAVAWRLDIKEASSRVKKAED